MKQFFRKLPGKVTLYIVHLLCVGCFIGAVVGAGLMAEAGVYTYEKEEVFDTLAKQMMGTGQLENLQTVLNIAYALRYSIYLLALLFIVCGIASFVALMSVSGRRAGDDGLYPGGFYRVPADLLLCVVLGIGCIPFGVGLDQLDMGHSVGTSLILGCVTVFGLWGFYGICVGCCMSIAVRVKGHTLWKNTLIFRCFALCVRLVKGCFSLCGKVCRKVLSYAKHVHSLPKFIIGYICMILLEIVFFALGLYPVFVIVAHLAVILLFVYVAYMVHILRQAAKALADGELNRQVDTSKLRGLCREHAEDLNHIAEGMTIAVEERLKSERMKTELITNVSHDIKTPLTSIINYASLISAEPCENAHITDYAKVLVRQSDRLKRLIEDLVEASKASTGNLEVHLSPCNAGIFIEQAAGEYEEKLEKAGLTLVASKPETEVRIMADGRRMWRVFDNLMNNICKYALSGTRVYLMLETKDGQAYFSFKNISRESLNVSTEELMERFVRGDASRNTEGNGLGLSIAQSMAQLQGGELTLSVDGDLFKAVLQFPVITDEGKALPHTVDRA